MSTRFQSFLERQNAGSQPLPLVHSTDSYHFRSIVKQGSLDPTYCPHFGEDLLYLFYGRPSYRVASYANNRTDYMLLPVCFVLKPDVLGDAKRIFPFDTGAFSNGIFDGFFHQDMQLSDFFIGTSLEQPRRMIQLFFGNNELYCLGQPRRDVPIEFTQMEVKSYFDLISVTGGTPHDDRRSAIEIQTDGTLPVTASIIAVVLPMAAMQDPAVRSKIIGDWGATPLTYPTFYGARPSEYHIMIKEKVYRFFRQGSYI